MNCFLQNEGRSLRFRGETASSLCFFNKLFFSSYKLAIRKRMSLSSTTQQDCSLCQSFWTESIFIPLKKFIRKSFLWKFSKFYISKSLKNLTQQRFGQFCFLLHRSLRQSGLRRRLPGQTDRWYREIFGWFRWSRGQKQEKRLSQRWTQFGKLDPLQFELSCVREIRPENLI